MMQSILKYEKKKKKLCKNQIIQTSLWKMLKQDRKVLNTIQ